MQYLTVDGMMSGTGIRDSVEGGYIKISELGISAELQSQIVEWLAAYEDAHYSQYADKDEIEKLDAEGLAIATSLQKELHEAKVEYYSSAKMEKMIL